ncbi:hypothetical protein ACLK17_13755 [Escherichia coli]
MRILGSADCSMEAIREELQLAREQFGDKVVLKSPPTAQTSTWKIRSLRKMW